MANDTGGGSHSRNTASTRCAATTTGSPTHRHPMLVFATAAGTVHAVLDEGATATDDIFPLDDAGY